MKTNSRKYIYTTSQRVLITNMILIIYNSLMKNLINPLGGRFFWKNVGKVYVGGVNILI